MQQFRAADEEADAALGEDVTIYRNDTLRVLSFANWTNSAVSRESLALAGFFYVGKSQLVNNDRVKCAWCGGEIQNWIAGDCPITEHVKHFPDCQYARIMADKNNITVSQVSNDELLSSNNMAALGIQAHVPAAHPEFSTFKSRFDTYVGWPTNNPQKPEPLATAGFYYCGTSDQVRCFHCDISLSKWEPSDNPWVEHARWFPECGFVALVQSKDFIDRCASVGNRRNNNQTAAVRNNSIPPVNEAIIDHHMNGPFAQVALNCGLQPERIRSAIRRRLTVTGVPFQSANSLIEGALNAQVNETSFSIPESTTQYASSSSSTRYPVDDETMDQVSRMIIKSVLSGTSLNSEIALLASATSSGESENNDDTSADEFENAESNDPVVEESNEQIVNNFEESKNIEDASIPIEIAESQCDVSKNHGNLSLEEENKLLRDARTCKICMDAEVSVVFLPCGHLVSCIVCATGLLQCPICRANVKGIVRTYLS